MSCLMSVFPHRSDGYLICKGQ